MFEYMNEGKSKKENMKKEGEKHEHYTVYASAPLENIVMRIYYFSNQKGAFLLFSPIISR